MKNIKFILFVICIILAIIPFLWLRPGEMDLGGDSSRLYFYDPIRYLQYGVLNPFQSLGMNVEDSLYFLLPFNILLIGFFKLLKSSYLIITLYNSLHLVVAFLSIYAIIKTLLRTNKITSFHPLIELSSIFGGLFYLFSPSMQYSAWDKAITTHAQFFLNPLMFYLLLMFFLKRKIYYLLFAIITSFIFSTNFSWSASPVLFSFYPFAIAYLVLYTLFIKRNNINVKDLFISLFFFITIHSFHLFPLFLNLIEKTGFLYTKVTESAGTFNAGLAYFLGVAGQVKLSQTLLSVLPIGLQISPFWFLFFIFPFILVIGLILNGRIHKKDRELTQNYLLLYCFFIVTLFFITANITNMGLEFYKSLFNFSFFAIFRNYYGQFFFVHFFFLTLLTAQSLFYILIFLKSIKLKTITYSFILLLILVNAIPFIRGDMINLIWNKGEKVEFKIPIKIDPEYEKILDYIRNTEKDGRYLVLPLTESFNQVLRGTQGGVYIGTSTISYLTGKSNFSGYQILFPFSQTFLELVKAKDYETFKTLLSILNIKYIFYNSDDVYKYFPHFPYEHVRNFMPHDHNSYTEFLENIAAQKKLSINKYYIYELDDNSYLPHIYIAKKTLYFDRKKHVVNVNNIDYTSAPFFRSSPSNEKRVAYLEKKSFSNLKMDYVPAITITKINPTRYLINVENASKPYILVLSDKFDPRWKLFLENNYKKKDKIIASYFNGEIKETKPENIWFEKEMLGTWNKKPIADKTHMRANAYANAWYVEPKDTHGKTSYTLILEMISQRIFYSSLLISLFSLSVCLIWLVVLLYRNIKTSRSR